MLTAQQLAQRRSSYKLHHDVSRRVHVVSLTEIVNRDDVWMAQHCRCASFATKAFQCGVVFDELACQNLHRHIVTDVYAARAIDHAHAALAELRLEFILAVNLVSDEWIRIDELNRGKGRDEMVFVI